MTKDTDVFINGFNTFQHTTDHSVQQWLPDCVCPHDDAIKWKHFSRYWPFVRVCAGNSLVTGEFPSQKPVTRSFNVFFDLRLNKRLSEQLGGRWFETRSLWRHCTATQQKGHTRSNSNSNKWKVIHLSPVVNMTFNPWQGSIGTVHAQMSHDKCIDHKNYF